MKLKLFMDARSDAIETAVNAWLSDKDKKINITRTEVTMSNVAERPNEGTHPCVVVAVWYSEL
jgi:hypothetical protein